MLKPRFSIRSQTAALLTVLFGGLSFGVSCAQADSEPPANSASVPTEANANIKLFDFQKSLEKALVNYPRRADGKIDWVQSPDIKSGKAPHELVDFLILRDKLQIITARKTQPTFLNVDLSDNYDLGSKEEEAAREKISALKSANDVYTVYYLNRLKGEPTYQPNNPTFDNIAIAAATEVKNGDDLVLKWISATIIEDRIRHAYEMKNRTKDFDAWARFDTPGLKTKEQFFYDAAERAGIDYYSMMPSEYGYAKRQQMGINTCYSVIISNKIDDYVAYLLSDKSEIPQARAKIFMATPKNPKAVTSENAP